MQDEHSWTFWVAIIALGVVSTAFVFGVLMGRISWPFDLILYFIGT